MIGITNIMKRLMTLILHQICMMNMTRRLPKRRLHEHVLLLDLLMKRYPKYMFLWIDFSKAFDSISHEYLFSVLQQLRFPICRGSRQGDPISGYLFNIAIDVLNHMILETIPNQLVNINGFVILLLMYCNDTVVCVENPQALQTILQTLDSFALFDIPKVQNVQYLGFKFGSNGLVNQSINFLKKLPSKYTEVRKLNLSPFHSPKEDSICGSSQFGQKQLQHLCFSTYYKKPPFCGQSSYSE
eukprot:TRINITY_DN2905_c0_g1_i18.p1 TRINITY_DN2905_c0_g1~~TRINITY_DN2905_c0_g1_i18.p1  ORF type:complete len:242 (-),score=-6.46 TRINITY_DN2905_c0_g1_i18:202-927(-)